jgi:hypothetical protein
MPAENIFAAYAQPVRSVMDYQGDMDRRDLLQTQLQGARRQNAIADLTAMQTQEGMRQAQLERQAMREAAAQSGGDRRRYASLLRNSGLPGLQTAAATEEAALQKEAESQSKIGKESADTEKTRAELARVQRQEAIQVIGALKTPEDAIAAIGASSDFTPQMKEQLLNQIQRSAAEGPAGFRDLQLRLVLALAAPDKQVAGMQPDYKNAGGSFVNANSLAVGAAPIPITQSADNAATQATSLAGQRRASADAAAARAQAAQLAAGAVTYQQDADGNLVALPARAVPGTVIKAQPVVAPGAGMTPLPGKDAGLTEGQSKALSFGARMQQNRQTLDELEKDGTFMRGNIKAAAETAGRVLGLGTDTFGGTLADIAGTATNFTQSEAQQRYETAKRNWIAANLRKESGAVIGTDEYRQAENQYFPQPGDSEKTKADKKALRATAEQTMLAEVPKNKRPKEAPPPDAPAGSVPNKALEDALSKYPPKGK